MSIACSEILSAFPNLLKLEAGDNNVLISDVCPAENGLSGSILFISSEKHFVSALQSNASALVVPASHKDKALGLVKKKTLISSPNVTMAMALVIDRFFNSLSTYPAPGIHTTAQIDPTSQISKTASIGAFVVIGKKCKIGDNVRIQANTVIEDNVLIGDGTVIMPQVYIGQDTRIGKNCEIKPHATIASEGYGFAHDENSAHHRIPQRGIVVIEDRVSIGAQCTIDRATFGETIIGEGTKIDNMVHIAHNCKIGKNCLLAGGTIIAGSTTLGNNVVSGGHTSIGGHIKIADNVQLGGRSAVRGHILQSGAYAGHPLEPVKDYLKTQASMKKISRLIKDNRKTKGES